jgi:hypothetical protein
MFNSRKADSYSIHHLYDIILLYEKCKTHFLFLDQLSFYVQLSVIYLTAKTPYSVSGYIAI